MPATGPVDCAGGLPETPQIDPRAIAAGLFIAWAVHDAEELLTGARWAGTRVCGVAWMAA